MKERTEKGAIAFDIGISPRTVEIYRAILTSKVRAESLSEIVRMAFIAGSSNDKLRA